MKVLTGKAFESFKAYIKKENGWTNEDFKNHYNCQGYNKYTLADIIEWLDSVGIYVNVSPRYIDHVIKYSDGDFYAVLNFKDGSLTLDGCNYNSIENKIYTRQQAAEKAIERAAEIYNNRGN